MKLADLRDGALFVTTAPTPARLGVALCRNTRPGITSMSETLPKGLRLEVVDAGTTSWGGKPILTHDPRFRVVSEGHPWYDGQVFIKARNLGSLTPRAKERRAGPRRMRTRAGRRGAA